MTYEEMFREIAQKYNLDWQVLAEQAWSESRLNPLTVGQNSEVGLLQIHPTLWRKWAPRLGVTDPFDAYSNVLVATAYLAFLRDFVGQLKPGDMLWLLLAYRWGADNTRRFLESGGEWLDVPASRRDYAVNIVLRASVHAMTEQMDQSGSGSVPGSEPGANPESSSARLTDLLSTSIPVSKRTPFSVRRRVA